MGADLKTTEYLPMPSFSMYFCICKPSGCNSGGILECAKAKKQHKLPSTSNSCWIFKTAHQTFYIHVAITTYHFARLSSSSISSPAGTSSPEVGVYGWVCPRKEATSEPRVQRTCAQNLQWTEHAWIRVEKSSIISTHLNRWRCALCIRVFQKWHLSKKKLPSQYNPFQGLYV